MDTSTKTSHKTFIGVLLLTAIVYFYWAWRLPIWSSDEGRFAEIAREMWASKDFVVPHFNYVEHFEKPILSFFGAALSIGIWGANPFGARFTIVLAALGGIGVTYFFSRRLFEQKTAELASVILATTLGYFLVGRFAMIDMVLTFLFSGSFYCLALACLQKKPNFYLAAYAFMGLAFLTKGLIGIALPLISFFCFLVWSGNLGEVKRMKLGWGVLIVAVIFVPWGVAISMQEPEFSYVFFTQQQVSRFATGHFGRSRPFWFFIPLFFALTFPWSFFLPKAVVSGIRQTDTLLKNTNCFLICWIVTIVVFFSVPKSKLPYYILPVAAPVAVLVGSWLRGVLSDASQTVNGRRAFAWLVRGLGGLVSVGLAGLNIYLFIWARDARVEALKNLLPIATVLLLIMAWITGRFLKRGKFDQVIWGIVAMIGVAFQVIGMGMERLSPYLSTAEQAQALKAQLQDGDVVAVFASPDHFSDLPFHLARRVVVVGSDRGTLTNEVAEEEHAEEVKEWFPSASDFLRRFNRRTERIFCLVEEKNVSELKAIGLVDYTVVQSQRGKLLIVNK